MPDDAAVSQAQLWLAALLDALLLALLAWCFGGIGIAAQEIEALATRHTSSAIEALATRHTSSACFYDCVLVLPPEQPRCLSPSTTSSHYPCVLVVARGKQDDEAGTSKQAVQQGSKADSKACDL